MNSSEYELIQKAEDLATHYHGIIDQRRKYTFEPYITHPRAVAKIVATHGGTTEMIAAAWCHDLLEDTGCSRETIEQVLGKKVLSYVVGLTDVAKRTDGNRHTRHLINCAHYGKQCCAVQTIKVADSIHNVSDIDKNCAEFAPKYREEKKLLLSYLTLADKRLKIKLEKILEQTHG